MRNNSTKNPNNYKMNSIGQKAKKRFGQNFLVDDMVIHQIIQIINPKNADFMVEIGPGFGALTHQLIKYVDTLHVVELDRDIIKYLHGNFDTNKLIIHEGDALKFNFNFDGNGIRVIGNLPYNISTPLLFHLSDYSNIIDLHFMLQKEVVDRLCAVPHTKEYGRLSIMMQYKFYCHKMCEVDRHAFDPSPQVTSAMVKLAPKPNHMWQNINVSLLNKVVTAGFNMRRKTIHNSLKGVVGGEVFERLGIDVKKRAENLTVDEYVALSKEVMHPPQKSG